MFGGFAAASVGLRLFDARQYFVAEYSWQVSQAADQSVELQHDWHVTGAEIFRQRERAGSFVSHVIHVSSKGQLCPLSCPAARTMITLVVMEQVFSRFVDDAASIATSGRWNAVNERLKEMVGNPGGPDNVWFVQLFAGLCSQVFSEYLLLKRAYEENDAREVAVLAWRARNLLELSVWSIYCTKSRDNARCLYDDAWRDMNGLFTAFKVWGEATTQDAEWFQVGRNAQQDLFNQATTEGIESPNAKFKSVRDAAEEVGIKDQFNLSSKFLSKFIHPTAMQIIMFAPNEAMRVLHRETFFGQGCLFFIGSFTALEKYSASYKFSV